MKPDTLIGFKQCTKCKRILYVAMFYPDPTKKDGLTSWCKECRSEYKKANRDICNKNNLDWKKRNSEKLKIIHSTNDKKYKTKYPERYRAQLIFKAALKSGKIKRQPCEICGDPNSQGHHEDYDKPLDVLWRCDKHHKKLHKEKKQEEIRNEHR